VEPLRRQFGGGASKEVADNIGGGASKEVADNIGGGASEETVWGWSLTGGS